MTIQKEFLVLTSLWTEKVKETYFFLILAYLVIEIYLKRNAV